MYGVNVVCGTLQEACFPEENFDFIIQKDLLEHVTHPREHMLESNRILKKGGYLWLITPNGDADIRPLQRAARSIRNAGADALPLLGQGHLSFCSEVLDYAAGRIGSVTFGRVPGGCGPSSLALREDGTVVATATAKCVRVSGGPPKAGGG